MWLIHKSKGKGWPTRFQRSKKGFVFWSLISRILLTQTWQRDCLRNTKSFSFIIFVSSSLLFLAGFVNVTSNIDEEDKKNGFARISLLFFTISRDIKENYEAQIRPAHFYIFKFVTIRVSFILLYEKNVPEKKRERRPPPPPKTIMIGLDFDPSKVFLKKGGGVGQLAFSHESESCPINPISTHFNKILKLLHYSW